MAACVSAIKIRPDESSSRWLGYRDYQAQRYMPALDGVRAIAVALAITAHLHERIWNFLSGSVGVTIFFVLSGYLITRLGLQEEARAGRLNVGAFYLRRIFRILPLYYFVLAIYAVLILGVQLWPTKILPFHTALPYYLGFFQEIPPWTFGFRYGTTLPFYQSWSMGIEEKFYLLWPMLIAGIPRIHPNTRLAVAAMGAAISLIQGIASEGHQTYHLESYGFILLGVSLALLLSRPALYDGFVRMARVGAPVALGVAIMTQTSLIPQTDLPGLSSIYAVAVTILIGVIVVHKGAGTRALSTPALVLIGRVSYGIYLVHILCLNAIERIAKPGSGVVLGILTYIATLALSTGVAYVLHRTLERPMIKFGRHISDRLTPTPLRIEVSAAH